MATAKWIIVKLGSDTDINTLCYSVLENGRDAEVLSLKEAAEWVEAHDGK